MARYESDDARFFFYFSPSVSAIVLRFSFKFTKRNLWIHLITNICVLGGMYEYFLSISTIL